MKYSKEERMQIGRKIYEGEMNRFVAAEKYGISPSTARDYMRLYRHEYNLPAKVNHKSYTDSAVTVTVPDTSFSYDSKQYENMSREELIRELALAKINEARLKKGYLVEGDGVHKTYIPLDKKNTK